jgi:predicted metal-dependent phosphotriesterase family hydrolase
MAMEISGAQMVQAVYGKQQFYADRTVELKIPKTVQVGSADKVTLSPDVQAIRSAQSPSTASQAVSATQASVYLYSQPVKHVTYEDPRRVHAHSADNEKESVDHAEPDSDKEDSEFTQGIASAGDTAGGSAAGGR